MIEFIAQAVSAQVDLSTVFTGITASGVAWSLKKLTNLDKRLAILEDRAHIKQVKSDE
jgi:hypothetical protein